MKVLLISDNKENIDFVDSFMAEKGYDLITYKWFIKAIDNIEEIKPDAIIVSASEYPRHWKTLASFVKSGIGGENVKLYLYNQEPLSEEEDKKAKALGIEGCITAFDNESFEKYFAPIEKSSDSLKVINSQMIFTNPNDGSLLSGRVISKNSDVLQCKIHCENIENGTILTEVSICTDSKVRFCSAELQDNDKESGMVSLAVCEYYEEI